MMTLREEAFREGFITALLGLEEPHTTGGPSPECKAGRNCGRDYLKTPQGLKVRNKLQETIDSYCPDAYKVAKHG